MNAFKIAWNLHKWVGIGLAVILALLSATGFLLLVKKDYAYLQPPTMRGEPGETQDFLPIHEVLDRAYAIGHPAFQSIDDIDRIDMRPGKRVHKIRSNHDYLEVQVDAITGAILSGPTPRRSDFVERLHDGSWFGDWAHGWLMPATAICMLGLVVTGLWIWITPIVKRRKRRRAKAARDAAAAQNASD
ncbi:MAG: PepSY domain-containing protein [Phycisphaerales bacterium]